MPHLARLLSPDSIAIVGLSDDRSKHGGRVLSALEKLDYRGTVWGVNPRLPHIPGVEMYRSLRDLPVAPDVVACATPGSAVPEIIGDAGAVGAGVVVVFAGGFAESGPEGITAQQQVVSAARESGVRVLGPNSGGVIRPSRGLAASFLTCLERPAEQIRSGPVGLVTQSGGTGSYIHNLAAERGGGLGISISTGNEADLGLADGIEAMAELEEIEAIALVIETVRHGPSFMAAVRRALAAGKPVVACRIGASEQGRRLTSTHTGAMARPAHVLDGVLDSLGVTITETPAELLDVADVMARARIPGGDRVGVVTHSGGIAILLTDLAERYGVRLPAPADTLRSRLSPLIDHGTADNPLDMGGVIGGPTRFGQIVDTFVESGDFDTVLAVSTAHPPSHTEERVEAMVQSMTTDQVVHLWMAGDLGRHGLERLRSAGLPVTDEPRAAMRALAGLARLGTGIPERPRPVRPVGRDAPTFDGALTEQAAKSLLLEWGLTIPEGGLAHTPEQASDLADALGGVVAVKVVSPDVLHKTEVGGLRLGVVGGAATRLAFEELTSAVEDAQPAARIEGVRVERQITGLEVIVGGLRDPVFGPIVLVGLGGIAAEGIGSPAIVPAPLDREAASRAIRRAAGLKRALARHGAESADTLADVVVTAGDHLVHDGLEGFDINPLVWTGAHWAVLDAVVVGPGG